MLVFIDKKDNFYQVFNSFKQQIENHEPAFILESAVEVNDLDDATLCLGTSNTDLSELLQINFNKFKDIYVVFDSKNKESLDKVQAIIEIKPTVKTFDINIENIETHLLGSIVDNRKKRDESDYLKKQVISISSRLENTLDRFEVELIKIKKIYKTMVPFRQSTFKGIEFMSKFFTGESSGGEFFDIIDSTNYLILGASNASSYLLSSSYLTHFHSLKAINNIEQKDIDNFLKNLKEEYETIANSSKKEITFEHLLMVVDLKSFSVRYFNTGNFSLYSTDSMIISPAMDNSGEASLERGKRYTLVSPGFIKNWEYYGNQELIFDVIKSNSNKESSDIIDELAFRLKSKSNSSFLKFDASVISIEVGENVIHSI